MFSRMDKFIFVSMIVSMVVSKPHHGDRDDHEEHGDHEHQHLMEQTPEIELESG